MADKPWKEAERRVAFFLTGNRGNRNPLSGSTSKHTAGDVLHPSLYVEVRYRASLAVVTWWHEIVSFARKEHKTPVLVLQKKYDGTRLYCVAEEYLEEFAVKLLSSLGWDIE